jgi:hypothetical protein
MAAHGTMAAKRKNSGVLRDSTPAERREEIVMLLLGGAYSLPVWAAILLQAWRQAAALFP